jgi:hypothetical protein
MNTGSKLVLPVHLPESAMRSWRYRISQPSQRQSLERRSAYPPDFYSRIQSIHFLERRIVL